MSRATSGCFVAKSYTSDAVNQAKQDPRITLLLTSEYDAQNGEEAFQFFTRSPEITQLDVTMFNRGSAGLDPKANFPGDFGTRKLRSCCTTLNKPLK